MYSSMDEAVSSDSDSASYNDSASYSDSTDLLHPIPEQPHEEARYNEDGESLSSHSEYFPAQTLPSALPPQSASPSESEGSDPDRGRGSVFSHNDEEKREEGEDSVIEQSFNGVGVQEMSNGQHSDSDDTDDDHSNNNNSNSNSNRNSNSNNYNNNNSNSNSNNNNYSNNSNNSSSSSQISRLSDGSNGDLESYGVRAKDSPQSIEDPYFDTVDDSDLSLESEQSVICCTPSPLALAVLCCLVLGMCGAVALAVVIGIDRRNDSNSSPAALTTAPVTAAPTQAPVTAAPTDTFSPTSPVPPTATPVNTPAPVTTAPTVSPTAQGTDPPDPRFVQLSNIVGPEVFQIGTPENAAADWILFNDPARQTATGRRRRLQTDEEQVNVQRFLMAYFYFATSQTGSAPWRACNPPPNSDPADTDCRYSRLFRADEDGRLIFQGRQAARWLSAAHECDWMGVTCTDDGLQSVTEIDVAAQTLTGGLVSEILEIATLRSLNIGYNDITGNIDVAFVRLEILNIENNNMGGVFPVEDFLNDPSGSLVELRIGNNQFSGSIDSDSDSWSNLAELEALDISSNLFSGNFPFSAIGKLSFLKELKADDNQFQGRLPDDIGMYPWAASLQTLWLSKNMFVGALPNGIGGLTQLIDLRLAECMFTSSLPRSIYTLTNLQTLHLQGNKLLSGSISPSVGGMTQLTELRLSDNTFTGAIPTELVNAQNLEILELNFNGFSSSVPQDLCPLDITETRWQLLQADCLPPQAPPNPCLCCTHCCSRDDGECLDNRDEVLFRELLAEEIGPQINEPDSPGDKALLWIVYDDPQKLPLRAPNLVQRFLMVLFYYHTSEGGRWKSCNPPNAGETETCMVLQPASGASGTFEDIEASRWLTGESECRWAGVECGGAASNIVAGLSLPANNLRNSIPSEMSMLTSLRRFIVPQNLMNGSLPEFVGSIPALMHLDLRDNAFEGTIIGRFFSGAAKFVTFDISENAFTGNFPNAIGRESEMVTLRINDNDFEGTITQSLSRLPKLELLDMSGNMFMSSIPGAISELPNLKLLSLKNNMLSQTIPDAIFTMSNLISLDLSENMLTGTISTNIGQMASLEELILYSNRLVDPIPTQLGALGSLQTVSLAFNRFQSSIPSDLCDLPMLTTLVSDCAGATPIDCECCTGCCDPSINICFGA